MTGNQTGCSLMTEKQAGSICNKLTLFSSEQFKILTCSV